MLLLINKTGFGGVAFEILQQIKFLLNHHRNIVNVLVSQKFAEEAISIGGEYCLLGPYGSYGPACAVVRQDHFSSKSCFANKTKSLCNLKQTALQ